jgi:hypothetical protein
MDDSNAVEVDEQMALDNRAEVESFRDGIDAVLTIGRAVVVIGAFENKAEALGHESDLCWGLKIALGRR